jgi:AraC-like DNA-binding protein
VLQLFSLSLSQSATDINLCSPKDISENIRSTDDLPRLLHTPEQATQAAWASIHALKPWQAQYISSWAASKWQRKPAHVLADLLFCCHLASSLARAINPQDSQKKDTPQEHPDIWSDQPIKNPLHLAALEFCESVISETKYKPNIPSDTTKSENSKNTESLKAKQKKSTSTVYLNELQDLLSMHQSLLRGRPIPPEGKMAAIKAISSNQFPDLQALAMFIYGKQYHLDNDLVKARHTWQLAAASASTQGWALLEIAAQANLSGVPMLQVLRGKEPNDDSWRHALATGKLHGRGGREQRIDAAKKYVQMHWQEKITSDQLAKASQTSIRTLETDFRDIEGMSLHTFLLNEKMARAKPLVLSTSLSLTEIANKCGYKSAQGFNLAYTKVHGISPIDDRSKNNSQ